MNKIEGWSRDGRTKKHGNKDSRVIRYMWDSYFFSLKCHYLKRSRDVTCTLLLYYPCFYPFLSFHPFFTIQFYSIVFMLVLSISASCSPKCYSSLYKKWYTYGQPSYNKSINAWASLVPHCGNNLNVALDPT